MPATPPRSPDSSSLPISHYENFPVASILCPTHLRAPVAAIYHFARTADDLADESDATAQQRLQALQAYRRDLNACSQAAPLISQQWPHIFRPLASAIQTHRLPLEPLHDLLDAFVQDVEKTRDRAGYANQAQLLDYCRRSANPVGRLLLHLYGVSSAQALAWSDDICTGLQLINFWQDPSRDLPRGRNYFTREDCLRFGVQERDLMAGQQTPFVTQLIAYYVYLAREKMHSGTPLVHRIPGRAGWELRLVVQGGLRILDKIEALQFATLQQRPILRWWDYPVLLWRALWM